MSGDGSWPSIGCCAAMGADAGADMPHDTAPTPPEPEQDVRARISAINRNCLFMTVEASFLILASSCSSCLRGFLQSFSLSPDAHQVERRQRDHLRGVDKIGDAARFVGLMRQL